MKVIALILLFLVCVPVFADEPEMRKKDSNTIEMTESKTVLISKNDLVAQRSNLLKFVEQAKAELKSIESKLALLEG